MLIIIITKRIIKNKIKNEKNQIVELLIFPSLTTPPLMAFLTSLTFKASTNKKISTAIKIIIIRINIAPGFPSSSIFFNIFRTFKIIALWKCLNIFKYIFTFVSKRVKNVR